MCVYLMLGELAYAKHLRQYVGLYCQFWQLIT